MIYVPANTGVNDGGDAREEVILELVLLAITYSGVSAETVRDVSMTYRDYLLERERLLASLAPSVPTIG